MARVCAARRRRAFLSLAAVLAVGGACTSSDEPTTPTLRPSSFPLPTVGSSPSPSAAPALPRIASDLPGRLLVIASDGSLVAVRPDGSDVRVLAQGNVEGRAIIQASWAPDGSRIAWSELDAEGMTARIVTADPAGKRRTETEMDVVAFYLSWDPTSSRVAYLGNAGAGGIEMGVVETTSSGRPGTTALANGAPFYFSWAPDGDRLLTHVDGERVDELHLDGGTDRIGASAALFQAPVWSGDGRIQVYAEPQRGERQSIIVRDAATGRTRSVATVDGEVSLVLSPDGGSLAVQALNESERDLFDRSLHERAEDVGVSIIDLASGGITPITTDPALVFSWSPDGERLAVLEPRYRTTGPMFYRWTIWDGEERFSTPVFPLGFVFLQQYTPFFTQYAQSMTLWSPDGSAFAYPVDSAPEPTSIWIQPVEPASLPYRLGTGSFVAWAPDPGR